jgi:hypothetical protein
MLRTESGTNQNWVAVKRRSEAAIASDCTRTNRLFVNSGNIFLMKIDTASPSRINIKRVSNSELNEDAVVSLKVYGIKVYRNTIASVLAVDFGIDPSVSAQEIGDSLDRDNYEIIELIIL